jgi:beta-galactosidase
MRIRPVGFKHLALNVFAFLFSVAMATAADSPREKSLMDFGWKFHLGDDWPTTLRLDKAGANGGPASGSFSDASWRTVNLPHDWAVELPFDPSADGSHGFHPVGPGFPQNNIAWYRKTFDLPAEDSGKRLWLDFDGVFRDCTVYVNGWFVGHHEGGYGSFHYDITDVANCGGRNFVAVKVDASEFEGWFYEGAGIYRHVWLEKTSPLAIAPDGIFIFSQFKNNLPSDYVKIFVQTRLLNALTNTANATVICKIVSPQGKSIATFKANGKVDALTQAEVDLETKVGSPILWSPESPNLYKLITTIQANGVMVDQKETEFGIRTGAFDANRGFLLNGKPYELKGACNHQDHAGVGAALPDALQYFRVKTLKKMGCNAIRTSHNPPTPELLEACDQLGLIVMDENRLLGSDNQNLINWQNQIFRDRNHPSVCIWSIANEEFNVQHTPSGVRVAMTMQDLVIKLDPTRPITYAAPVGDEFDGTINSIIEVRGWNYHTGKDMDDYHREHPLQPQVGTEQGSTVSTRGIYTNDAARGYVSAYDSNAQPWSSTGEYWWSYFAERPWLSGGFVWTGFDYRGEPTPYGWPCVNSHFGVIDVCGFPKDNFYYYQSVWTDKPMVHLLPHWNWPGKEGQKINVWCYSNCKQVELFLNGQTLGRQTMPKNSHLEWNVPYAPGTLSAKGYDAQGRVTAETKVETTSEPAAVQLAPDRQMINANGEDISVITVSVTDSGGRVVPVASNKIQFELSGPGKIIGVGNGDPSCHEPDQFVTSPPVRTQSINNWRWETITDAYATNLLEMAEIFDDGDWQQANVLASSGPLQGHEQGAFRAKISLTAKDLAASSIVLMFNHIGADGFVYVNGQKVGESHNWLTPTSFDVKPLLHPGENTIAASVANWGGSGGINSGVELQFVGQAPAADWQRSVFNGLAQIIVQSTKEPGEIKLTAHADGLASGTLTLTAQPASPRPSVASE